MVSHCATDRRFLHIPQLLHISHISVVRRQITNHANAILHYSPMKKKGGGTLAGIPRASGERNSPVGNGTFSNSQVSSASFIYGLTCPSLWYGFYIAISKLYDDEDLMVVESLTPFASLGCRRCKRPGANLCIPPLPSRPTMPPPKLLLKLAAIIILHPFLPFIHGSIVPPPSPREFLFSKQMLTHETGGQR